MEGFFFILLMFSLSRRGQNCPNVNSVILMFWEYVVFTYLDPSEFSSTITSAFKCSALNSSALRSSARDMARPRKAERHSGPGSPVRPAGMKGYTGMMATNIFCSALFKTFDIPEYRCIIMYAELKF